MPKEKAKDPHRFNQCYWLIKKIGDISHRFALGANGLPKDATKEANFIGEHSNFVSKGSMTKDYEYSVVDTYCVCFISQRRHEYISVTIPWAIANNKKILTDINIIKTFPGYDPRWIKIIPDFKKIDAAIIKWLTDTKIVPNYTHKDYYCAKNFVMNIKNALNIVTR